MMKPIFILNGPNLNLLGAREPDVYGTTTLAEIESLCRQHAAAAGLEIVFRQSNSEARLIDWIQEAIGAAGAIVINPAGLGTTSIAILDALRMFDGPIIEVHLSNIHRRETFRHNTYVSLAATGVLCGLGARGYAFAVDAAAGMMKDAPRMAGQ